MRELSRLMKVFYILIGVLVTKVYTLVKMQQIEQVFGIFAFHSM